jgi:hypothetical protein
MYPLTPANWRLSKWRCWAYLLDEASACRPNINELSKDEESPICLIESGVDRNGMAGGEHVPGEWPLRGRAVTDGGIQQWPAAR